MAKMSPVARTVANNAFLNQLSAQLPQVTTYECGFHALSYRSTGAGCPVCAAERENKQLKTAVQETTGKLRILTERIHKLESWYDLSMAMRDATPLLDDNDLEFLKATLYEWRNTKSLTMKVTHGSQKKRRQPAAPNGFIVMPRKGDPYGHLCSSVGGMAIADYYEDALNSFGVIQAMTLLVRGLSQHLPGGQE